MVKILGGVGGRLKYWGEKVGSENIGGRRWAVKILEGVDGWLKYWGE